jgi:5-methylcytosine-specific restriction enzyme subunit McrC
MLRDCSLININEFSSANFGRGNGSMECAIQWLQKLSKHIFDEGQLFKFTEAKTELEPIVYADPYGQWWTGRYIGSLSFEGISIEIHPRFGMEFVAKNIPLNNFIPVNVNSSFITGDKFIHFLQALLWLNQLSKAARHTLPTVKIEKEHTASVTRGRIDVRNTIKARVKDSSNIVSISSYKKVNNPVTTVVVLAYIEIQKWFPEHNLMHWMPNVVSMRLQQMIDVTPRHSNIPSKQTIKKSRLGAIAKAYIPLTRLSFDILKNKGIENKKSDDTTQTLLLDVAELWEVYVLDVLKEAVPSSMSVLHGTYESDSYLLTNSEGTRSLGKLLPDYLLQQSDQTVSVADAKYKRLGDAPWMSPKRDDLYQMTSYLSKFSECDAGSFYYPDWGDECDVTQQNPWLLNSGQEMNFIALPIDKQQAVLKIQSLHGRLLNKPLNIKRTL